jgi:hypothetical protein
MSAERGQLRAIQLTQAGLAARGLGCLEHALELQTKAAQFAPDNWAVQINLGTANQDLGNIEEAISCFSKAWNLSQNPLALTNLALANLRKTPTQDGFRQFMARWQVPHWPQQPYRLPCPHILDQLPVGRIIVMPDQGYGDTLMCLPFIRCLIKQKPDTVVLVKTPLLELTKLALSDVTEQVHSSVSGSFAGWLTGFDIPAVCSQALADYRSERLEIEKRLRNSIQAKPDFEIGLVWRGNPDYALDKWRGIPLELLLSMDCFGLHKTMLAVMPDLSPHDQALAEGTGVVIPKIVDFADTAKCLLSVSKLISTDTSTVHLAGLLGVQTQLLLSRFGDWRWGNTGSSSVWYESLVVSRQTKLGDWSDILPA